MSENAVSANIFVPPPPATGALAGPPYPGGEGRSFPSTKAEKARARASQGFPVLPLWWPIRGADGEYACACGTNCGKSAAKHPIAELVPNGIKNATADLTIIDQWWTKYPEANIGWYLDKRFVVLDYEPPKGDEAKLTELQERLGELPETLTKTRGTDRSTRTHHLVYLVVVPEGRRVRGKLKTSHGELVLRNDNYLVDSGSQYINGDYYTDDGGEIAELSAGWLEAVLVDDTVVPEIPSVDSEPAWLAAVPVAKREADFRAALEKAAGDVKGRSPAGYTFGLLGGVIRGYAVRDLDVVLPAVRLWNKKCVPQWTAEDLVTKVRKAYEESRTTWGQHYRGEKQRLDDLGLGDVPVTGSSERPDSGQSKPPTDLEVKAALEEIARDRSNAKRRILDRDLVRMILDPALKYQVNKHLDEIIEVMIRRVPGITDHQIVTFLVGSFVPIDDAHAAVERQRAAVQESESTFVLGEDARPLPTQHNIGVALGLLGVSLSYDEFADRKLITRDGMTKIIEDKHVTDFWLEVDREYKFRPSKEYFRDVLDNRCRDATHHPVKDYLASITWDGVKRNDTWLIKYAGAEDTPYTRAVGRLLLVAACRRIQQPGCKYDEMVILESPQGTLKSSALSVLAVKQAWFSDSLILDADQQRQIEATKGKWIVEAPELHGMSKANHTALKSYLARAVDEARKSYGRETEICPRQFVLVGTTNETEYLKDATGNRRYWPVKINTFDLEALARDRDQLWAEAAAAEAAGESIRLDKSLWPAATEAQDDRYQVGAMQLLLGEKLGDHEGRILVADIYDLVGLILVDVTPAQESSIGNAMRKLGWTRKRARRGGKLVYVYQRGTSEAWLSVSGRSVSVSQAE